MGTDPMEEPTARETGLRLLVKIMAGVAAIALAAMMLLTVADVFGRYFFNKPIYGAWEVIGMLLIVAGMWGVAYCQLEKGHICVDVLFIRFPKRIRAMITTIGMIIGFLVFSVLCQQALVTTKIYYDMSSRMRTDTLSIPFYPFMFMLAISAGVTALVLLVDLAQSLREEVK